MQLPVVIVGTVAIVALVAVAAMLLDNPSQPNLEQAAQISASPNPPNILTGDVVSKTSIIKEVPPSPPFPPMFPTIYK